MIAWLPLAIVAVLAAPAHVDRVDRLAAALERSAPRYLDATTARAHAWAALEAETRAVPAEALLGLAWRESRFSPLAGPRGSYPVAPAHPPRARVYRCGVVQADARTWRECVAMRPLTAGYRAGAEQLGRWVRACHGSLRCGLAGYARGWTAVRARDYRTAAGPLARAAALRMEASLRRPSDPSL